MTIVSVITLICAAAILACALHVINHMDGATNHFVRAVFIALGAGEFSLLAGALFGYKTTDQLPLLVINAVVLFFVMLDRRRRRFTHS